MMLIFGTLHYIIFRGISRITTNSVGLLADSEEIFLYYSGTLGIITKWCLNIPLTSWTLGIITRRCGIFLYYSGTQIIITRSRNILILLWDPGNYYQMIRKYSYLSWGPRNYSQKCLGATTTSMWKHSSDNNVWYAALCELYRNFPIFNSAAANH